jgi:hypothetical protein
MGRDRLGRWEKGSTGNAGGVTQHEIKAARRLKLKLATMVDSAADTLQRSIAGEDVEAASISSAKFIIEMTVGKAGQTKTIDGHVDHVHQHSIDMNTGYLAAMKSLAGIERTKMAEVREQNGQVLKALKPGSIVDIDPDQAVKDSDKERYSERGRAEQVAADE